MQLTKILSTLLVGACLAGFAPPQPPPQPPAQLHTFRLRGDVQVFPLRMIDAFPFIEGEVNGQKGKFMFDTGNAGTVSLNSHLLKLPAGQPLAGGFVGSGQRFTSQQHDTIASIALANGLAYHKLLQVKSNDYDFLEGITPDCLGQIGFGYVEGYILKLDYLQRVLTCYQQTAARQSSHDYLRGEQVLAVLATETRKRPGNVLTKGSIGGIPFTVCFDTGQQGSLYLDPTTRRTLLAKGLLVLLPQPDGDSLCTLRSVALSPGLKFKTDVHALSFNMARNKAMDAALGLTDEPHELHLGYAFLSQFTTIWDSQAGKMYICAPQ